MAGEIKDFSELDYEPYGKGIALIAEDKTISFKVNPVVGNERQGETREDTAKLYWDENRRIWLAEVKGEFLESS